ncbi:MAG: outer membrane protein assembly factor BamD [Bryobacteraceae bacterium]|jgi:outer membrane protein assembly factor BamD
MAQRAIRTAVMVAGALALLSSCRHKYENPIAKNTDQPDKVLFDKAINDLEHSHFEVARLEFNTLINTYDSSEYLAKASLGVADSWYREGGSHGLAQAEAAYKDFILFFPAMEEAAEAQEKVCKIHYDQMEKADRDPMHTIRAEEECRAVLTQFPNSKFAPEAEQLLRNIQENLAMGEYKVGKFYQTKGNQRAAANRLEALVDQYPNFSQADDAAWLSYQSYNLLGDRVEKQQIAQLTKLVRDYPLSAHAEAAKEKLQAMNAPVPEADPAALARMKYEMENRGKISLWSGFWGGFSAHPNLALAAKSGAPSMQGFRPTIPLGVPASAPGQAIGGEVTVSTPGDASALETSPDARANPPAGASAAAATGATGSAAPNAATGSAAPNAATGSAAPNAATGSAAPNAAAGAKGSTGQKNQKKVKTPKPPKPPKAAKTTTKKPQLIPAAAAPAAPAAPAPPPQQ